MLASSLLVVGCSPVAPTSGGQTATEQPAPVQSAPAQSASAPSASAPSASARAPAVSAAAFKGFKERPAKGHTELVAAVDTFLPYGERDDGRFVPDDALLDQAEAALPAAIAKEPRSKSIGPHLASYHRQYFGLVVGPKRYVYVNGFCQPEERMREQTIMVKDGGDCFFQALYDVAAKRYEWVRVNGSG